MAIYNARMEEIKAALREPKASDTSRAGERGAQQAQVLTRYTGFMNDMIAYEGWRDVALQEALALLKEESSSPAGPAYHAKWAEYFAKKSAEATRMVMDALKDAATVAPELCRFAQTVSGQEAAFFGQCGRMTLAHMSGQAQLYTLNFYREADRLEEKRLKSWEEIERVNLHGRLDAALQDYQNTWTVNVDGLSDEDKNGVREVWKTELDVLAKGIVEAEQYRVRDQIRMYLNDKMQELMTKLKGSKVGGE